MDPPRLSRLTERIRIKARNVTEQYADLRALVDEAERNEDHLTLGYQSWTAYVSDVFGEEPLRLPRDARIPMSNMLAEKGMSNRAIGAVLGVDEGTVRNDRQTGAELSAPGPERINRETGEVESLDEYRGRVLADAETNHKVIKLTGPESVSDPAPARLAADVGWTAERPRALSPLGAVRRARRATAAAVPRPRRPARRRPSAPARARAPGRHPCRHPRARR